MARTDLEQLVFTMSADVAQMRKQLARASGDVDRESRKIQRRMDQTSAGVRRAFDQTFDNSRLAVLNAGVARVGVFGGALEALGPAGLVGAAGVAAVVFALGQARKAIDFADAIDDVSAKIGISAEALQEWRFIVEESGGSIEDADQALLKFTQTLGKAQAGLSKPLKVFEELGFTEAEIDAVQDVDAFLEEVIRRLGEVGRAGDRAGKAARLGLEGMLPVINENADAVDRLRAQAHELGLVMSEDMIRRGAEAQREFEVLSRVLDMQLKQAFIDLGPVLVKLMRLMVDLAQGARSLFEWFQRVEDRSTETLRARTDRFAQRNAELIQKYGMSRDGRTLGPNASRFERWTYERNLEQMNQAGAELHRRRGGPLPPLPAVDLSGDTDAPGGATRRGRSGADSADRERDRAQRVADAIYRAQLDELEARQGFIRPLEERLAFEAEMLERRQAQERVELEREYADKKINETEYARLKALMESRHAAEERNRKDKAFFELQDQELENLRAIAQLEADLLGIRSSMAKTAEERRRIELQLLELADQERRDALKRQLDRNEITPEQYTQRMGLLDQIKGASTQAINQRNQGPIGQFIQQAEITGDRLQELAVNGLGSLNAALIDSIGNARNAGEAIRNVFIDLAKQVLMMLLNQSTAQILTAFIPRFAQGTNFAPGGLAIVGEQGPELVNLPRGSQVKPTDATINALTNFIPRFAQGTNFAPGGPAIVGEQGPELVNLPRGTMVTPSAAILRALGGSRGETTINVNQYNSVQANGDRSILKLVKAASQRAYDEAVRMAARQQISTAARFRKLEG